MIIKFCRIELRDILGQLPDLYLLFQTSFQFRAKKSQHAFLCGYHQLFMATCVQEQSSVFRYFLGEATLKFVRMLFAVIIIAMRGSAPRRTAPACFGITP